MAADSGPAIAMFFGTISPSSTCSTTTIVIAMTNDTVCSTVSGMPSKWNGFSSRCATAGSPTRPSRIEQTVMPSCAPASISGRFSPARMTVTALCLPCSARASSRSRRAEINANSAPTKNALARQQQHGQHHAEEVTHQRHRSSSSPRRPQLGQLQLIDPAAVHPQHGGQPAHRVLQRCVGIECRQLDRLALFRDMAELLQHQPADGLVFAFRGAETGGLGHLVDAQQTRHLPAAARRHDVRRLASSCSSRMSPTISSITSSTVTMPAVPPYSSTTSAVCRPLARSCAITSSPSRVDGTLATGCARLASRVSLRCSRRHFEDLFDVHDARRSRRGRPRRSGIASSRSGSPRPPDRRRCRRPRASRSSVRGVISSSAVREPNCSDRSTSVAVTGSSDPAPGRVAHQRAELLR